MDAFYGAQSKADQGAAIDALLSNSIEFDELYGALRRGRSYKQDVPRGLLLREHSIDGVRHPYMILVPEDYDPSKKLPVRFELHGGMGAKEWRALDGAWADGWTHSKGRIVVLPAGWWDSMWWEHSQVKNFQSILREVRSTWNVDENRTLLVGTSDGGAALFFQAMRTPDPWAAYLGSVAPPDRLTRRDFRPDGQMHLCNLRGQDFQLNYGSRDKKVPLRFIEKYMALFQAAGAQLDWYVLQGEGHSFGLPDFRFQAFVQKLVSATRDPLPDSLVWATENPERYGRRLWLVIDELGSSTRVDKAALLPRLGTPLQLRGSTVPRVPFGKVELLRTGNLVEVQTTNVAQLRLLISPDEFDLEAPIRVLLNAKEAFHAKLARDPATLLRYAAEDLDRTQLYAGEIILRVP